MQIHVCVPQAPVGVGAEAPPWLRVFLQSDSPLQQLNISTVHLSAKDPPYCTSVCEGFLIFSDFVCLCVLCLSLYCISQQHQYSEESACA